MKLPVSVARDVALALNEAADRAMEKGAHEFEVDQRLCRRLHEDGFSDLATAIEAEDG